MRRSAVVLVALLGARDGMAGERAPAPELPASSHHTETALPHGRVVRIEKLPRREVFIPAGIFEMGLDEAAAGAAREQCRIVFAPEAITGLAGQRFDFCGEYYTELVNMLTRNVFVDAFAIDRDEVSVADYRRCVDAGGCELDALVAGDERYIGATWPMVNVNWGEAQQFCRWRGGRLPTEAEWERAARGDRPEALWPWGELDQPRDFNHGQPRSPAMREIEGGLSYPPINFFGDPDDSDGAMLLAPAGSYPWGEGPFGTRDQAGNVAEWTADAYFQDGPRQGYKDLSTVNPLREGPPGQPRVVRGGSWRQPTFLAQSNLRDPFNREYQPERRFSHVGFRCARTLH
jgi:sulfatase modifying factor 1